MSPFWRGAMNSGPFSFVESFRGVPAPCPCRADERDCERMRRKGSNVESWGEGRGEGRTGEGRGGEHGLKNKRLFLPIGCFSLEGIFVRNIVRNFLVEPVHQLVKVLWRKFALPRKLQESIMAETVQVGREEEKSGRDVGLRW
eukprot:760348-Hanusia_phi.AAC.15